MTTQTAKRMDISQAREASCGAAHVQVMGYSTSGTQSDRIGGPVPPSIPRDQAYYWSARWQRDEAEALVDLRDGDSRTFDSAADAIKWLLSDED